MCRRIVVLLGITMLFAGACSSGGGAAAGTGGVGANAGSGGSSGDGGWDGHIIHGIDVALGPYALAVSDDAGLTFRPEIGTPDDDAWHGLPSGAYDLSLGSNGMTAVGHYRLVRTDDMLAFDISLDATSTGGGMSSSSELGPFLVGVQKPGATTFKMNVRCTNVAASATGQAQGLVSVVWDDPGTGDQLTLCRSSANVQVLSGEGTTGGSAQVAADETGYAVFQDIRPSFFASATGAGGVAHAAIHLEIQFVPQP